MLSIDHYKKQPLLVQILFHPESTIARDIALQIHMSLNVDPVIQGLRIPTIFLPENEEHQPPDVFDLDEAELNFVLVLAEENMDSSQVWCEFVADIWEKCNSTPHRCIPVQLSEFAWPLSKRLEQVNFLRAFSRPVENQPAFIIRHTVIELCRYLHGDSKGSESSEAPTTLFISHTKMDIKRKPKAVEKLKKYLSIDQPVNAWFDSGDIPSGSVFSKKISAGIQDASLLCVLTENYASREWCRKEILLAKEIQRPVIVVDALANTEVRSFPYLGNLPVIRWNSNPQTVIDLVLKETLRHLHNLLQLSQWQLESDVIFNRPPELSTLISQSQSATILYPDPPLGTEETAILKKTGITITTPLQRLTRAKNLAGKKVALSMSESTDCHKYGIDKLHLEQTMLEVSRYLLIQGMTLVYGGHLGDDGYTNQLIEMVRAHNSLDDIDPVQRIINYVGWPIPLSKNLESKFKFEATLERVPQPADINENLHPDFKQNTDFFPAEKSALHRYAWARGMTEMRKAETRNTHARIVLGGTFGPTIKVDTQGNQSEKWYASRIPGVLEEVIASIEADQPIFILGGFGGVAAMIVDILEGKDRKEMSWEYQRKAPHAEEMKTIYEKYGQEWIDYQEIITLLRKKGISGLNTLIGEEDHKKLFHTRDPVLISNILIKGLSNLE